MLDTGSPAFVTLTPNPSIDRTITLDRLDRGEVHRATDSQVDPGGKGINVARALTGHGARATAVLPSGGPEGWMLRDLLDRSGTSYVAVRVAGTTRMNIAVVEPDGVTTKLNEPGPELADAEVDALLAAVDEQVRRGVGWLVGCGSLPPGMRADVYADLVHRGHAAGCKVAVDTSGAPLAAVLSARPDLIKPNQEELEELLGHSLPTLGAVQEAALEIVRSGVETVVVSLGRHGALLVNADTVARAEGRIDRPVSTVGAGDSLLAGYLYAVGRGATPVEALASGVSWGSAAVTLPGSRMPTPVDVAAIAVSLDLHPDLSTPLD